jgi:hypothetical protein
VSISHAGDPVTELVNPVVLSESPEPTAIVVQAAGDQLADARDCCVAQVFDITPPPGVVVRTLCAAVPPPVVPTKYIVHIWNMACAGAFELYIVVAQGVLVPFWAVAVH